MRRRNARGSLGNGRLTRYSFLALIVVLFSMGRVRAHDLSSLERSLAQQALDDLELVEDPSPEGKRIEHIEIYRLDVFDARDPIPDWFNIFHGTSRESVIRREVLVDVGQLYHRQRVEETERNLRALRQLSLANILVAKGSRPDLVRLIVITKDVWSLRLNSDFAFGSNGLEWLLLNPAEENLAGTQTSVGLIYRLDPYRHQLGGRFIYPRIGGSRFRAGLDVRLILNRESGDFEGSTGVFTYSYPLYSRYSPWALSVGVEWLQETTRILAKNRLASITVPLNGTSEVLPWLYRTETLYGQVSGTRSFGVDHKFDLRFGLEWDQRRYRADHLQTGSPLWRAYLGSNFVPVSDVQIRPFIKLSSYETRFHRILSMETLGMQEDLRLGYETSLSTWVAAEALGSTRDIWGVAALVGYTVPWGTGLLRASVSNTVALSTQGRHDALFVAAIRLASPWLRFGRLHLDADLSTRYENYRRSTPFFLGGNNRLRGYPSNYDDGQHQLAMNLEFRSGSVDILSAQTGFAIFYDVGDATYSWSTLHPLHSVGAGARIVFPQADRAILRADWGFPLGTPDLATFPGAFFVTFGQAFALP